MTNVSKNSSALFYAFPTATLIWTHMIDLNFSAVVSRICRWISAEVKSYTQHCCRVALSYMPHTIHYINNTTNRHSVKIVEMLTLKF